MTQEQVQNGIYKVLGTISRIMVHKGNHRWESGDIPTDFENSGLFSKLLSHYNVTVYASPMDVREVHKELDSDISHFKVNVGWKYLEGGTNGTALDYFYRHSTDQFLTREEARGLYMASVTKDLLPKTE